MANETQPHEYDIDKRFAHVRVEVLGREYTDVVQVNERFPNLPEGLTVYIEHIDAVDLKQESKTQSQYPRVEGKCPECGSQNLFVG